MNIEQKILLKLSDIKEESNSLHRKILVNRSSSLKFVATGLQDIEDCITEIKNLFETESES